MTELIWQGHIFFCNHEREPHLERVSCGRAAAILPRIERTRALLKDAGLQLRVRAQKAGCMEACEEGPTVAVYPVGVVFRMTDLQGCDELVLWVSTWLDQGEESARDLEDGFQAIQRIQPESLSHVQARLARS